MKIRIILTTVALLTGCICTDYYNSKEYKAIQRKRKSIEMFEETHEVRKKCAVRKGRPRRSRRKKYYS
jgi:hypothetical protein